MSKKQKKRSKKYSGVDAKVAAPTVTRVSAEELSRFQEWWRIYGKLVRLALIAAVIIVAIVLCVIGIVGLIGRA